MSHLLSNYQAACTHVYLVVCSSMHGYLVGLEDSVVLFNELLKFIPFSELLSSSIHARLFRSMRLHVWLPGWARSLGSSV